jgi:hypothetical protein
VHFVSDTCWQFDYYHFTGPLIRTEQYRDNKGNTLHGATRYYTSDGFLDSTGTYLNGRKNGDFNKLVQRGKGLKYQAKYVYQDDHLVETADMQQPRDTTRYPDEKESEFPGGISRWQYFLNKNLRYPGRALNNEIQGNVRVLFVVDAEGRVP